MSMFYDIDFATKFRELTLRHSRPDDVVTITNVAQPQAQIVARGYKYVGMTSTGTRMWMHPSGKELWVLPQSMATTTQTLEEHPAVVEARNYANDSTQERDRLIRQIMVVRNSIGRPDYSALYNKFLQDFNRWQTDLNWIREEGLPPLLEEVSPSEADAMAKQAKRLNELNDWKTEEFPNLIRGLPAP